MQLFLSAEKTRKIVYAMVYLLEQEIIEVLSKTNSSPQFMITLLFYVMKCFSDGSLYAKDTFWRKIWQQNNRSKWKSPMVFKLCTYKRQLYTYSAVHYHLTVKQLNLRINLTSHRYAVFSLHKPEVIIWPWWPVK